jgi:hypothetical protein
MIGVEEWNIDVQSAPPDDRHMVRIFVDRCWGGVRILIVAIPDLINTSPLPRRLTA